jgi:O-antigen ligase
MNKNIIQLIRNNFKWKTIILLSAFLIMAGILLPLVVSRMEPVRQTLTNFSLLDMRSKLFHEGIRLVSWHPVTGVGLNRSLGFYAEDPVTDIFFFVRPSGFYRIHNMFLEMASEIGIPGTIFFLLFLFSVIIHYAKQKPDGYKQAAFYGLLGLIGISMLNPFFHTSSFRWFLLLSAIILI